MRSLTPRWHPRALGLATLALGALSPLAAQRTPGGPSGPPRETAAPTPTVSHSTSAPPNRGGDAGPRGSAPGSHQVRTPEGGGRGEGRGVAPPGRGTARPPRAPALGSEGRGTGRGETPPDRTHGPRPKVRELTPGTLEARPGLPGPFGGRWHRWGHPPGWMLECHRAWTHRIIRDKWFPAITVPEGATEIIASTPYHFEGRCFAFLVPKGGSLRVDIDHPNVGWLDHRFMGRWGRPEVGMVQNFYMKRNGDSAQCSNPGLEPTYVYLLVSDPADMAKNPNGAYRLTITRSWSPQDVQGVPVKPAIGIFAHDPMDDISAQFAHPRHP